ncbi:hypothetical protein [Thermodesulfovibrio sp. 3462-1]|uniref:Outer membrane protein beta-barrel domain-containing protein n=1 Tax=Thermodesulfovibrio obliviosus TaxID=3118332 RepID=A0AAU8H0D9_9BACT
MLVVALLMLVGVNAYAVDFEAQVGPEISHITYKEPGVMTEKGWFYGMAGRAEVKFDVAKDLKLTVGPELKLAKGRVDYSSPISGDMNGIDDTLFEARALVGLQYQLTPEAKIKPYTGFGYRSLVDDSSGKQTSTGAWGYERWIRYYYIPVGVAFSYDFTKDWTAKAYAEYDIFLRGKVKTYLSSVPGYEDITNTQKSGYGLRAGAQVEKKFTGWAVSFGPYVKYWKIKDSEVTYDSLGRGWIEPRNHSTEIGSALTLNF